MKSKSVHKLALFGNPVAHSLSPIIHQEFAKQFNLQIDYQLITVETKELKNSISDFFAKGGKGANVTLPHKNSVISSISQMTQRASQAQAVNTLFRNENNEICGDNTDGIGFLQDLKKRCQFDCQNKNILILGAGGAAQGIVPEINKLNPMLLVLANRSVEKAKKIVTSSNAQAISLDKLELLDTQFDLIIHASSLGHKGKTLKFLKSQTKLNSVCYDLSYGDAALAFINYSQNQGILNTYDGIGMLIEQAAAAFEIWFNKTPDTTELIQSL